MTKIDMTTTPYGIRFFAANGKLMVQWFETEALRDETMRAMLAHDKDPMGYPFHPSRTHKHDWQTDPSSGGLIDICSICKEGRA